MSKIKVIIFDYDGVIVDSFSNIHEIYKKKCEYFKLDCPDDIKEFRRVYGYNSWECYDNLGIQPKDHKKAEEIFKQEIVKKEVKLFDGIGEVLEELSKKYKLILVTANRQEEAESKMKSFGLQKYFDDIIGKKDNDWSTKKSEKIQRIIDKLKISRDEVISVGDRDIDFDIAESIGIKNVVIVNYGWGHNKCGKLNHIEIDEPGNLLEAIEKIDK